MKKIKIRDKEYNCSNKVYWHIKSLESENECFNMEVKSHEQSEYELEQENKQLKERLNKIEKYASELEEQYWWVHKDICKIIGENNE